MKKRPLKDWVNIILTIILYFLVNPIICWALFVNKHYVWFTLWFLFSIVCFVLAFFGKRVLLWFLQKKIEAMR